MDASVDDVTGFKICVECGAEFQAWVEQCSDCGGELVPPDRLPADVGAAADAAEVSPVVLACLVRGGPWELRELAEALGQRGLSSRIGPYPLPTASSGPGSSEAEGAAGVLPDLGLYVEEKDLERAVALHQQLVRDSSHAEPEATSARGEAEACPACGAALGTEAESCAECGLEFPPLEG